MYYLHIKALRGEDRRVPLPVGTSTVGRRADNTIVLEQFGVSAHHAEIEVRGGRVVIRDLASSNGTFVNGDRVTDAALAPGDRILIGSVMIVLQEALSDRILLRVGSSEPAPAMVEMRAAGTVPGVAEPGAPLGPDDGRAPFARIMELDERGCSDERLYAGALLSLMRATGAVSGFLLGIDARGRMFLRAAAGLEELVVVDRGVIEAVAATGAPRGAGGHLCLPLGRPGEVTGVAYLLTADREHNGVVALAQTLEPALSAIAAIAGRRDAEAALARVRVALASRAEWPAGSPPSGIIDDDLLGHSPQIRFALREIARLAPGGAPVMIRGEPGSGVAQAARRLHALDEQRKGPLLTISCAGFSAEHLERELFGEPGRAGRLRVAAQGSVFFEEVADLPPATQRRLATVVEGGGGEDLDVRLVLGTRHTLEDLETRVAEGRFSEALLAATRTRQLRMPPLRERPDDIVPLAQHFMRRAAATFRRRVRALSSEACRLLRAYSWRGNMRELSAVIHRAVLLTRDEILDAPMLPADLVTDGREPGPELGSALSLPWKEAKLLFERFYFEGVMESTEGNITRSSRIAGIARKNFYSKLRQHGLLPRES